MRKETIQFIRRFFYFNYTVHLQFTYNKLQWISNSSMLSYTQSYVYVSQTRICYTQTYVYALQNRICYTQTNVYVPQNRIPYTQTYVYVPHNRICYPQSSKVFIHQIH